jgi:hypothetical protein
MAGDGASEINREQVMDAISDRNLALWKIDREMAAGPHPFPEQRLADLRMLERAITDEMSELTAVLRGLRLGDFAFMEEIPPGRLDALLGVRADRVPRLPGVPLEGWQMEAALRACKMAFEMPLASSSAGQVMATSDAPPSARDQAAVTAVREELARLQI